MSQSSSGIKGDFEPVSSVEIALMWRKRFGISEDTFSGCSFYKKAQSIWVCSSAPLPGLSFETIGMRMISLKDRPWKPTTAALRVFGKHATKNSVRLTLEQAKIFMAGESQMIEADSEIDPGYVVATYKDVVLGCGLYSRGKCSYGAYSNGKLISQIPKESRILLGGGEDI